MFTIIISVIAVLMVSSLFLTYAYSYVRIIFHYIFFLLGLLGIIWLSKLTIISKISLSLIFICYYYTNFSMVTSFINSMIKYTVEIPPKFRKTDEMVSRTIIEVSSRILNIKINSDNLPDRPTIMVCNYAHNQIENIFCLIIPVKMSIVMASFFKRFLGFGSIVKRPIFINLGGGNYSLLREEIPKHIAQGSSIFSYVTNIPFMGQKPYQIYRVSRGMFKLAKELDIPVTLVCMDYIFRTIDGAIPPQNFNIHIGETFKVEDAYYSATKSRKFFKNTLKRFHDTKFKRIDLNRNK